MPLHIKSSAARICRKPSPQGLLRENAFRSCASMLTICIAPQRERPGPTTFRTFRTGYSLSTLNVQYSQERWSLLSAPRSASARPFLKAHSPAAERLQCRKIIGHAITSPVAHTKKLQDHALPESGPHVIATLVATATGACFSPQIPTKIHQARSPRSLPWLLRRADVVRVDVVSSTRHSTQKDVNFSRGFFPKQCSDPFGPSNIHGLAWRNTVDGRNLA